jgi:hypothetical protein
MSEINLNKLSKVTFNGNSVKHLIIDGVTIWEESTEIDLNNAVYFGEIDNSSTDYFNLLSLKELKNSETVLTNNSLTKKDGKVYAVLIPQGLTNDSLPVSSGNKHLSTGSHKLSATTVTLEQMFEIYSGLKELTEKYIKENNKSDSADSLIALYGRSTTYTGSEWDTLGGTLDDSYINYVSEYSYFRNIKFIQLPDGNELDAPHFWAVINMSFKGNGDIGGWAGDLVTFQADIDNDSSIDFPDKSFGYQDWISDADAYSIYANSKSDILAGMKEYYNGNLTEEYRVASFYNGKTIKKRFSDSSNYLKLWALELKKGVSNVNDASQKMQAYLDKFLYTGTTKNNGITYKIYKFDIENGMCVKIVQK